MLKLNKLHMRLNPKTLMLKAVLTFSAVSLSFYSGYSMDLPLYSQYMMNAFVFNSAMAGYDGFTSFSLISRQQWLGMPNAPRTISLSFQTRMLKRSYIIKSRPLRENKFIPARSGRVGLGVNIFNDRNGYFSQTGINMSYAYHIPFPNSQLSFGVAGSITQYNIDRSGIDFRDKSDPLVNYIGKPFYAPDANAGVFYMNKELYLGASIEHLLQTSIKFGNSKLDAFQTKRHYYFIGGYRIAQTIHISYEPTFLVKTNEQFLPYPQVDLSCKVIYYDNYWMGLSFRSGSNTVIFFMGIKKNFLYAGYAFDYSVNTYQRNTFGSHELLVSLKFGDSARRYKWLNRY
jgi:type IX secretion system PorP/SprF family membrane protein